MESINLIRWYFIETGGKSCEVKMKSRYGTAELQSLRIITVYLSVQETAIMIVEVRLQKYTCGIPTDINSRINHLKMICLK